MLAIPRNGKIAACIVESATSTAKVDDIRATSFLHLFGCYPPDFSKYNITEEELQTKTEDVLRKTEGLKHHKDMYNLLKELKLEASECYDLSAKDESDDTNPTEG